MRFLAVQYKINDDPPQPPTPEQMTALGQLATEAMAAGAVVLSGGLAPTSAGIRLSVTDGKRTVSDGPFTEAKELVGGMAVYEVSSKDEAIEWATRFAKAVGGDVLFELRPLFGGG